MSIIVLWTAGAYLGVGAVVLWFGREVAFQHFAVARSVGEPWFTQAVILALTGGFLLMLWPLTVRWLFDPRERQWAAFEREWGQSLAIARQKWASGSGEGLRRQSPIMRGYRARHFETPRGCGTVWVPDEHARDTPEGEG